MGGCCELNTTAHGLIADIGTQLGIRAATASGEDVNQCVALETTRVRQRIAIEIWSNYQDYICARLKFADPTPDKQRANEDEAVTNDAEQELHAPPSPAKCWGTGRVKQSMTKMSIADWQAGVGGDG